MSETTKIEWCDATFNGWRGCAKVSEACRNCYAETLSKRNPAVLGEWGVGAPRVLASDAYWRGPLRWNERAAKDGVRRRVFSASLADVFDAEVPDAWRLRLFTLIRKCDALDWLLLTKRPAEAARFMSRLAWRTPTAAERSEGATGFQAYLCGDPAPPLANVWIGVSVENQKAADERIPILLEIRAAVRFLSMEPLLGPVDLTEIPLPESLRSPAWTSNATPRINALTALDDAHFHNEHAAVDWIIAGGESGPKARPSHPAWFRSVRDQAVAAGVPFLFKQWGEWAPNCLCLAPTACREIARPEPGARGVMFRCGKRLAGRELDGRTWDELPRLEVRR